MTEAGSGALQEKGFLIPLMQLQIQQQQLTDAPHQELSGENRGERTGLVVTYHQHLCRRRHRIATDTDTRKVKEEVH